MILLMQMQLQKQFVNPVDLCLQLHKKCSRIEKYGGDDDEMSVASARLPGRLILKVAGIIFMALGVLGVIFSILSLLDADFIANLSRFGDSFLAQIALLDRRHGSMMLTLAAISMLARTLYMLIIGVIIFFCASKTKLARLLIVLISIQLIVVVATLITGATIIRFGGLIPTILAFVGAFQNAAAHRR